MEFIEDMDKPWQSALESKEKLVCLHLSLKMNEKNQIDLSEKEMYEYCGYKSPKYFGYSDLIVEKGL